MQLISFRSKFTGFALTVFSFGFAVLILLTSSSSVSVLTWLHVILLRWTHGLISFLFSNIRSASLNSLPLTWLLVMPHTILSHNQEMFYLGTWHVARLLHFTYTRLFLFFLSFSGFGEDLWGPWCGCLFYFWAPKRKSPHQLLNMHEYKWGHIKQCGWDKTG